MCTVSMVYDSFTGRFPFPNTTPVWPPNGTSPQVAPDPTQVPLWNPPLPADELRQLIAEFREAVAAARRVDVLTQQPDCEDAEKARLEERVAELETRVAQLEKEAVERRAFPDSR